MDEKNWIIISGIGLILLYLVIYLGSKSPLDIFGITVGVMLLISGFYTVDRRIKVTVSYITAEFGVNIVQWLILIYIYYYNHSYVSSTFFYYLIGAVLITAFLVNQVRKNYLQSSGNGQNVIISFLRDKTRLILLFTGVFIIIASIAGFITSYAPIFLYGITLGLMVFIHGFYFERRGFSISERRDIANALTRNIKFSFNYVMAMGVLLILQFLILRYFIHQMSIQDWSTAGTISLCIAIIFSIQIYRRFKNIQ
ncbi:hypothetical protein FGU46_06065 [Methanobacterium sp. CWC-01]|uniref:hypothetical protein n=1 Tax=Methanobacterium aridiramus TaxID=2584467 RepID=UPI0025779399|nr:hypothetical protein [Methanobacterium sp. CWC-01]WJI09687.1 hypothetical protein FGU46_06065 [Methanobacterium sp. CWC-01]